MTPMTPITPTAAERTQVTVDGPDPPPRSQVVRRTDGSELDVSRLMAGGKVSRARQIRLAWARSRDLARIAYRDPEHGAERIALYSADRLASRRPGGLVRSVSRTRRPRGRSLRTS
jgi:hypothetical protein